MQLPSLWGCRWVVLTEGMEVEGFLPCIDINGVDAICSEPVSVKSALIVLPEMRSRRRRNWINNLINSNLLSDVRMCTDVKSSDTMA